MKKTKAILITGVSAGIIAVLLYYGLRYFFGLDAQDYFDYLDYLGWAAMCWGVGRLLEDRRLNLLLGKPDAIFVAVNFSLERSLISKIHHRLLWLSLGSLLFSERLYAIKSLPSAQVNIVSTQFQLDRLRSCLGSLMPETMVFSNKIDTNYYTIPEKQQRLMARKRQGIKEGQLHIIYAGRWIVTKGICQLIRVLDIWPLPSNAVLTLVGNIEEGFGLAFSFAHHKTFSHFLNEEILQNKSRAWLHFQETQDKEGLRDLFWSADLFVNTCHI